MWLRSDEVIVMGDLDFVDVNRFAQFKNWRASHNSDFLSQWQQLLSNNPEAAYCEAAFWNELTKRGVRVEPVPRSFNKKTPDFKCSVDSSAFYVEVTCIMIDTVTHKTGLTHLGGPTCGWFRNLNQAIVNECSGKADQCANLDAPCLLAIGAFHSGSRLCFSEYDLAQLAAGRFQIQIDVGPHAGKALGEPRVVATKEVAAFLRQKPETEYARSSISAILLAGFAYDPPVLVGLLHPNPARAFDPRLLGDIRFYETIIDDDQASIGCLDPRS